MAKSTPQVPTQEQYGKQLFYGKNLVWAITIACSLGYVEALIKLLFYLVFQFFVWDLFGSLSLT
jgi:hypothetical protein